MTLDLVSLILMSLGLLCMILAGIEVIAIFRARKHYKPKRDSRGRFIKKEI